MSHSNFTQQGSFFLLMLTLSACGGGGGSSGDSNDESVLSNPVASSGSVVDVARSTVSALDGSGSSDPDGDSLTFTWTQTGGPDVTSGAGFLTGVTPTFNAPADVGTLFFDLVVNDGNGNSSPDRVQVNVLEHLGESFYVDGNNGDDLTGDGSRDNPFASISHAISAIPAANYDIYVQTIAAGNYDETAATLGIPDGTSLYGGYDDNWVRDVTTNRTRINGHKMAVDFLQVDNDAWFSGFDLVAADSDPNPPFSSSGISADSGSAGLFIQDNSITSGNIVNTGAAPTDSYGLRLAGIDSLSVLRNSITAGDAGDSTETGANGPTRINGRVGQPGGPLVQSAGKGGCDDIFDNGCPGIRNSGGTGGAGGNRGGGNGSVGNQGWTSTTGASGTRTGGAGGAGGFGGSSTNNGGHGGGGLGGNGSSGGNGGVGSGSISSGFYANNTATNGIRGQHGRGGGGGGGGEGAGLVGTGDFGGGGGGGGQGGIGGQGGGAGGRGGASIGILIDDISNVVIDSNTITSGDGGSGAAGGFAGVGGSGGNGGLGVNPSDNGKTGGNGGGGGKGGDGGQGGAGPGGPSYSVMVGNNMSPQISNNQMFSGNGGAPGADGSAANGGAIGGRDGSNGSSGSTRLGGTSPLTSRSFSGTAAQGGWSYNLYDNNPSDGMVPVESNNAFTIGTAGLRGTAQSKNF